MINTNISEKIIDNKVSDSLHEKEFKEIKKIYELILLYYVLKTNTDYNNALSSNQITALLNNLLADSSLMNDNDEYTPFSERTINRKLTQLVNLSANPSMSEDCSSDLLSSIIMGGVVKTKNANGVDKKGYALRNDKAKRQKRYYFEPVLTSGDMNMIIGSILSNRYLSQPEQDYLVKRLQILHECNDYGSAYFYNEEGTKGVDSISNLPPLPMRPENHTNQPVPPLPVDSVQLLAHIQTLNDAIRKRNQIEITYGIYDADNQKNKNRITFTERATSILNPYALMWNNGGYYLIAANIKHSNPTNYRVDRIISVKIHSEKNEAGEIVYPTWKEIPATLKDFFTLKGKKTLIFDSIAYANRYPNMRISQTQNLIDLKIECTSWSLQILVDAFGTNIKIEPSPMEHSEDELDYNGKPQQFYVATVRKVQYDNARDFCLAHPQYLTALAPVELVKDVKNILSESVKKLERVK